MERAALTGLTIMSSTTTSPKQEKQLDFLLDLLAQYGIEADTYAESVQQYVKLLNTIFPAGMRQAAPSRNVAVMMAKLDW